MNKTRLLGILLSLTLILGLLPGLVSAQSVAAAGGTTSLTVTKYDVDGTTVLQQETLTYAQMEALLPVQGDGTTRYYYQGPTFQPTNLWDPAETVNLKNKGAVKGTDIKDLVERVGGAVDGDLIQVKANDGYGERFQYGNIYNPTPAQGKMVVAWYTKNAGDGTPVYPDGAYVPAFADGMQLIFMAETTNAAGQHVFGHEDMRTTLPEANWHHYYDGPIEYPSANGLALKYISEINVYKQAPTSWSITVTGAVSQTVGQSWFENALSCHEEAQWTDGSGNVWSGLPLWYLVGLADDETVHGIGAFNDPLARAGYDVEVRAADGYAQFFESEAISRSSAYIVANKVNGAPLSDAHYPLRLVGTGLTAGAQRVGKIASINLHNIPQIETWTLQLAGASDYAMKQAEFEDGVNCTTNNHSATYTDASGVWKGLPLWLLVGFVDDDTVHGAGAFNDLLATLGYQVRVVATDNYSYTFNIGDVAHNDNIIVANTLDGAPLPANRYPLRLVGSGLVSGGQKVGQIARIELLNLPTVPTWTLTLSGAYTTTVTAGDFLTEAAAHPASWVDGTGNTWTGVALWRLAGRVDDASPSSFNDTLAAQDYGVKFIASDGYSKSITSTMMARNDSILVANQMNGAPLPENRYPLRVVGAGLSGGQMVSMLSRIELVNVPALPSVKLPLVFRQYVQP